MFSLKSAFSAIALTSCLVASSGVMAQQSASINVQGQGAVAVTPDAYSVTFILEEKGETVAKLNKHLSGELDEVVKFLLKQGVKEENIQSMQVRLNPYFDNTTTGREQSGFVLSREIQITHSELSSYDKIIDGVLGRGVDRIQQFEFVASGQSNAYEQALITAVSDAKARAALLAKELGVKVGDVVAISESGGNMPVPVMRAKAFAEDMSASMPGQQQINARVNVTFSIEQ